MIMHALMMKSSDVREKFSETIDEVIRKAPKIVNRRRDHFVMMNVDHLSIFVEELKLHAVVEQDEHGVYIAALEEIEGIFADGMSKEEALKRMVQELVDYTTEYLTDRFATYYNAPNRKRHFPYVIKVILQKTPEDVLRMIHVK